MKFREAFKFSLDLFLLEKAVFAVERFALERPGEAKPAPGKGTETSERALSTRRLTL
jgi:hypothetical protein